VLFALTDIVNQKVALKFLESAGHQTEVVENGALALEAVKKNFYDVRYTLCASFLIWLTALRGFADRPHGSEHAFHGRNGSSSFTLLFVALLISSFNVL